MFLNPAEPVWPGLLKAALVLALLIGSGIPLAWAIFGNRPRQVWIGYTPIVGVGLHLLTANLCAWLAPGPAGSWLGIATALGLSTVIAVRLRRTLARPNRLSAAWIGLVSAALLTAGLMYVALANRTHVLFTDEEWHLPLAATMARGDFPPISPFSPSFGAAYHYGADLLAASLLNLAGIAPWTAFFLLTPMVAAIFAVTAATAALDFGASRVMALGTGLVAAFADPSFVVGLPTAFGELSTSDGPGGLLVGFGVPSDEALFRRMGPALLNHPHFALGMTLLLVMAASLHAGRGRWPLASFGVALALLPLAETAAFLVGVGATGLYCAVMAWRWSWQERRAFAAAAGGGLLLAGLGGGALTDALFRNPGGAGTQFGLYPDRGIFTLGAVAPDGGLNLQISPLVLVAGLIVAAMALKSRGLGFLAAAAAAGIAARQVLNFEVTGVDTRLIGIPYVLAALGTVAALGTIANRLRPPARHAASAAMAVLIVVPTAVPRTISGLEISTRGIYMGYPTVQDDLVRYANQTRFADALRDQWRALDWMRRELPDDARVLATNAPLVSMATGRTTPQSDRRLALFNPLLTPLYMDALRFLARQDLQDLNATHLYVTPDLLNNLDSETRTALEDPRQFRLLHSPLSTGGARLAIYEIQPDAGRESPSPSSFRRLEALGRQASVRAVGGFLSFADRQTLLLTFAPKQDVVGPSTYLPRTNVHATYRAPGPDEQPGLMVLDETHVPLAVGKSFDDAIWHGHGLRAYSTVDGVWSRTWRPQPDWQLPPSDIVEDFSGADASCDARVIGEPDDLVSFGEKGIRLTGLPQTVRIGSARCDTLQVAWDGGDVPPFIQLRSTHAAGPAAASDSAGLAFDGGVSDGIGVFHLWYRNPNHLPVPGGSELRLYPAGQFGLIEASSPTQSIARWLGLIELSKERFTDRFEFDAAALRLNGAEPIEKTGDVVDGDYVLTLNIAEEFEDDRGLSVRRVIPVLQVTVLNGRPTYRPLSGIVGVD